MRRKSGWYNKLLGAKVDGKRFMLYKNRYED